MKIIDILNKIANGEEIPKKIRINGCIYEYQGDDYLYIDENNDNHEYWLFSDGYTDKFEWLENYLRVEIEIIEEELKYTIPIVEHNKTITKHLKEIERLNNDIKILLKENENKEKVILKQENIIKEARELANKEDFTMKQKYEMRKSILEILDKGE